MDIYLNFIFNFNSVNSSNSWIFIIIQLYNKNQLYSK